MKGKGSIERRELPNTKGLQAKGFYCVVLILVQKVLYRFRADSPILQLLWISSQGFSSGGVGPLPAPPSWLPAPATLKARAVSVPRHVVQGSRVVPPPVRISGIENDVCNVFFWYLQLQHSFSGKSIPTWRGIASLQSWCSRANRRGPAAGLLAQPFTEADLLCGASAFTRPVVSNE